MMIIENRAEKRLQIGLMGDFDAEAALNARPRFEEIAESWSGDVVVDFARSEFLDSSGIGAIVFLYKRLAARKQSLEILNIDGQPLSVIQSLRVDRVIPITCGNEKVVS